MDSTRRASRELTIALTAAVIAVWLVVGIVVLPSQPILGGDFMQFYAMGALAYAGDWAAQYDWPRLHAIQQQLVPGSGDYYYAPAYPPLVAAVFAPFATLPFAAAFIAWSVLSGAIYAGCIGLASRLAETIPTHHLILGSLIFPPFVALVVLGQTSALPLFGFSAAAWALSRSREFATGLCLSLVATKPQFGLGIAATLLAGGSWRVAAGCASGVLVQVLLALLVSGSDTVVLYANTTVAVLADPALVSAVDDRHSHALIDGLRPMLSRPGALAVWLGVTAIATGLAVKAWRPAHPVQLRMAGLILACVLLSPHTLAYDAVLLAPVAIWLLDWARRIHHASTVVALAVLAVAFVTPGLRVAGVPLTVPVMLYLLAQCAWPSSGRAGSRSGDQDEGAGASSRSNAVHPTTSAQNCRDPTVRRRS